MDVPYDLGRFVEAQREVFPAVVAELEAARKTRHWMWFVFPQIAGLGRSQTAVRYAIGSLDEAEAYLAREMLGPGLRQATSIVMRAQDRSATEIFGQPDDMKFRSSMTLFARASPNDVFAAALVAFFGGEADLATIALLG